MERQGNVLPGNKRYRVKNGTSYRKCGKVIKKGRLISSDGLCFRCDENRTLTRAHIIKGTGDLAVRRARHGN